MSSWGWSPQRNLGIWRYGAGWVRPVLAAMPYLTVGLLLMMMAFLGGTLTVSNGVRFDLPEAPLTDAGAVDLVALVMPMQHETIVLFDDTRYVLGDKASMRRFSDDLAEAGGRSDGKTLLVLADRRIDAGRLMELMSHVRQGGLTHVLFAGKRKGERE